MDSLRKLMKVRKGRDNSVSGYSKGLSCILSNFIPSCLASKKENEKVNMKEYMKEYMKRYRQEHREQLIEYNRKYRETHREYFIDYNEKIYGYYRKAIFKELGEFCNHCGMNDIRCLQIDHIDGGGSKEKKLHKNNYFYYKIIYEKILSGSTEYQILCANCNWIKRSQNREF